MNCRGCEKLKKLLAESEEDREDMFKRCHGLAVEKDEAEAEVIRLKVIIKKLEEQNAGK